MSKVIEITNPILSDYKEFQIFGLNIFKVLAPGDSIKIEVTSDEEEFYYERLAENLSMNIGLEESEEPEDPEGTTEVSDEESLKNAISDDSSKAVKLTDNISVSEGIDISKSEPFTFNGNGKTVTTSSTGKAITVLSNSTIKDLTIESTADNKEWHSSYNVQFYKGNHTVENVKLSGGNAGMIVNGATVDLAGTIDVSGNTFGGIEVSKGSGQGLSASVLNINDATLVNTTEEYGKPTIWIDGTSDDVGIVNGADNMTMIILKDQKQYYLDPANAQATDSTASIDIPDQIEVGVPTEFSVSTAAGSLAGTMVRGTGGITKGESLVEKLEYKEGDNWIDMTGESFFGSGSGFPLADATSYFRVTMNAPGEVEFHIEMIKVEDDSVISQFTHKVTVYKNYPVMIGDTGYDSISDAVLSADSVEISLNSDINENVSINAGKSVIISGNDHKIHGILSLKSGSEGQKGLLKVSNVVFDGEGNTIWAAVAQNQTETAGQSSFDVEFDNCQFKNLTKKALYMTEISSLRLTNCTFENCATDEMNDPNTYGDYVVDCNLVGVKNVEVSVDGCTFSNNGAQKADIKVTQRGGESDEGASDMPQGIIASVDSFSVTECTFNDDIVADVAIGTNNKSESTNPDAVNITGNFGMVTISGNTTETVVSTPYDGKSYTVAAGQTFTKEKDQDPVTSPSMTTASYTKEELMSKNKSDLQSIASKLSLDTSGTKDAIADRIVASYNN